jgi:glutathione S-transferase
LDLELLIIYFFRDVKLFEGETHSESYRNVNVTGTVPALVDSDVSVFDR